MSVSAPVDPPVVATAQLALDPTYDAPPEAPAVTPAEAPLQLSEPLGQPDNEPEQSESWGSWLGSSLRALPSKTVGAVGAVSTVAGGAVGAVSSRVSDWRAGGSATEGAPAVAEGEGAAAPAAEDGEGGAGMVGIVKSGVGKVVSGAGQVASKTGAVVSEAVGTREAREQLKEVVKDKAKAAAAGTAAAVGSTASAVGEAVGTREAREQLKESVKDKAKAAAVGTAAVVGSTASAVKDRAGETAARVGDTASAVKDRARERVGDAVAVVGSSAAAVGSKAAEKLEEAKERHPQAAAAVASAAAKAGELGRTAAGAAAAGAAVAGAAVAGAASEVGARVGNAVRRQGGAEGDGEPEYIHLEGLLAQLGAPGVLAELETASVASRTRLREAREAADELGATTMEGEHVYLHTIFHEATAEPPAGAGSTPPPALPPAVEPSYAAAAAAVAKHRDEAAKMLATCRKRVRAQLGELSKPRPEGAPPPSAQELQLSLYSRRAALSSAAACVASVSEASVQGLAEACGMALQVVLHLEKSLQRHAQALRLGCASDDAPAGELSAGGLACGVAAALLSELATLREAYEAAARDAAAAALENATEESDELCLAKEELEQARQAFSRGLDIDYGTARGRLAEATLFLLPVCALLGPSMRAAVTARC